MRILEHRIFSKSFGGKIRHIWTDVTYRIKKKIGACVLKAPVFWAGNLKFLNSPQQELSQQKSRNNNFLVLNLGYLMRRLTWHCWKNLQQICSVPLDKQFL